ncbi:MAG: kelch motif-containing protein, partial [Thermoplasmata archaeon]|nr:kelch motif-containing protein [Thermoplasmata archaeon]
MAVPSSDTYARHRHRLPPTSLFLLGAVAFLLLAPPALGKGPVQPTGLPAPTASSPHLAPANGVRQFQAAVASLGTGAGPAEGIPLGCQVNPGGITGLCGTPSLPHFGGGVGTIGPPMGTVPRGGTPGALFGAAMAYDAAPGVQAVILFGGARPSGYVSAETWSFVAGVWTNDTPFVPGPPPRWGAAMAYDALDGYLLMEGGCLSPSSQGFCAISIAQTWSLGPQGWAPADIQSWQNPKLGPGAIYDAAMTYDGFDNYILLFGGAVGWANPPPPSMGPPPPPPLPEVHVLNNTWSFSGGFWNNISGSVAPPPRWGASLAFYPPLKIVILFGGTNRTEIHPGTVDSDTWQFSNGTWQFLRLVPAPEGRWDATFYYDPVSQVLRLIGGALDIGTAGNDEWDFAKGGWGLNRPNVPPNPTVPDPRYAAMSAYDLFDRMLVLVGGLNPAGSTLSDAWAYSQGRWTELASGLAFPKGPSSRWEESLTFQPGALVGEGQGLLFGGEQCTTVRCFVLGD